MFKYCKKCEKTVALSLANHCPDCGTLLTAPPRVNCPACSWNQSGDNRYCIQCGEDLSNGAEPIAP